MASGKNKDHIFAAGTVIVKGRGLNQKIAVIHRPHRQDWSFPKGKIDGSDTAPAGVQPSPPPVAAPGDHSRYPCDAGAGGAAAHVTAPVVPSRRQPTGEGSRPQLLIRHDG